MAHPNEDLVRKGYDAFKSGDVDTMSQLFDEDITWIAKGDGPMAGEYHGHQEVFANFAQIPELTDAFQMDVHDVLANDEHAVALVTVQAERNGKTLDVNAVHVYHVEDGQVSEAWIVQEDPAAANAFWAD